MGQKSEWDTGDIWSWVCNSLDLLVHWAIRLCDLCVVFFFFLRRNHFLSVCVSVSIQYLNFIDTLRCQHVSIYKTLITYLPFIQNSTTIMYLCTIAFLHETSLSLFLSLPFSLSLSLLLLCLSPLIHSKLFLSYIPGLCDYRL